MLAVTQYRATSAPKMFKSPAVVRVRAAPRINAYVESRFDTINLCTAPVETSMVVSDILQAVRLRDPDQPEFHQAVEEVLCSIAPALEKHPEYLPLLKHLVEPEQVVHFAVPWVDDEGKRQVNRGYRVHFSTALGPNKGGLRFDKTVKLSIVKFLAFEQIFKNALTTLPMGGGKGGSDFDPKGKSDVEIMRFCQSFMTSLYPHIGPNKDIPAGDIGVGAKEIGYLFGQYKRLAGEFTPGVITGKQLSFGGSPLRPEATGYGLVYFVEILLREKKQRTLEGMKVAVSGSGNVATYCVEKLLQVGAIPVTLSDSDGTLYEPHGITEDQLAQVMQIKESRGRLSDVTPSASGIYVSDASPWQVVTEVDIALPCATQNEVTAVDAKALVSSGMSVLCEGANMPCDSEAIDVLHNSSIEFGPAKASNAGGVAVSGLEMSQNSQRMQWSEEEVDSKLKSIMSSIFHAADEAAKEYNVTLQAGANIAGFLRWAEAKLAQGVV